MAAHSCHQEQKLAELEKKVFPDSVSPFTFFVEDALFKQNTATALESLAKTQAELTASVKSLQERSDSRDDAAGEAISRHVREAREELSSHADNCPLLPRMEAVETTTTALHEEALKRSWIKELKPVVVTFLSFVVLEIAKRVAGL